MVPRAGLTLEPPAAPPKYEAEMSVKAKKSLWKGE
jgi:hypothetical protein